jgi:hypothetical protein
MFPRLFAILAVVDFVVVAHRSELTPTIETAWMPVTERLPFGQTVLWGRIAMVTSDNLATKLYNGRTT